MRQFQVSAYIWGDVDSLDDDYALLVSEDEVREALPHYPQDTVLDNFMDIYWAAEVAPREVTE